MHAWVHGSVMAMPRNTVFNIFGGDGKVLFPHFDTQEVVNMILVQNHGREREFAFYPRDGLKAVKNLQNGGTGRFINEFDAQRKLMVVVGSEVYVLDAILDATKIGSMETSTGIIGFAQSAKEVLLVDGSNGWVHNVETGTFSKIVLPDFPTLPTSTEFFADRFIVSYGESDLNVANRVGFSGINNVLNWDAQNFFSLPFGERVIGLKQLGGRLYVFGNNVTQVWYNAGAPAPFTFREAQIDLPFGCAATGSIATDREYLCWLTRNKEGVSALAVTKGNQARLVSSQAIETEFEGYSRLDDANGFVYKNALGDIFYQINFPTANKSWQFKLNSELPFRDRWSQLTYNANDRHLANDHTYFGGKHYMVSYLGSKIYEASINFYDDDGFEIKRMIVSPTYSLPTNQAFVLNRVQAMVNRGASVDGFDHTANFNSDTDAEIHLSVSKDFAQSYGNRFRRKIGKIGAYRHIVDWHKLGYSNQFTLRFEYWNRTKFGFFKLLANITAEGA